MEFIIIELTTFSLLVSDLIDVTCFKSFRNLGSLSESIIIYSAKIAYSPLTAHQSPPTN